MTNKILIPVDTDDFNLQIVPYIQRFFDPADTALLLLRIESDPKLIEIPSPAGEELTIYVDQQQHDLSVRFKSHMLPLSKSLESAGYAVEMQVRFGKAAEEIEMVMTKEDIDLVAMTTHGRHGFDRLIHGSVAEHVLRHSSTPVLLLHPLDDES